MPRMTKEEKQFKTYRAQIELKVLLYKLLDDFKSQEEPKIELTQHEKMTVFASVVSNYMENSK